MIIMMEIGCCECGWVGKKRDLTVYDHRPACPKCLSPDDLFITDEAKERGIIAPTLDEVMNKY